MCWIYSKLWWGQTKRVGCWYSLWGKIFWEKTFFSAHSQMRWDGEPGMIKLTLNQHFSLYESLFARTKYWCTMGKEVILPVKERFSDTLWFLWDRVVWLERASVSTSMVCWKQRGFASSLFWLCFWILRSDRYVETTTESSVMNHDELICLTNVTLDEEHAVFGFYLFQQAFHCHSLIPSRHSQFRSTKSLCSFIQFTSQQFAFTRCFGLRDLRRNWLV